jgi:toxin ParE1/3/4
MMRCGFSTTAELDLEEIGDYIARDNPKRAISFIAELKERCFLIVHAPHGSPLREDLGAGVRMVSFGYTGFIQATLAYKASSFRKS